jgi:hypothetical protein
VLGFHERGRSRTEQTMRWSRLEVRTQEVSIRSNCEVSLPQATLALLALEIVYFVPK